MFAKTKSKDIERISNFLKTYLKLKIYNKHNLCVLNTNKFLFFEFFRILNAQHNKSV